MSDAAVPQWVRDFPGGIRIYRAGLAAGIERGQKFLDDLMLEQGRAGEYGTTAECARLFRALVTAAPDTPPMP